MLAVHEDLAVIGEACDGLEAVEKIEQTNADLLFLDIELSGMTGFEVLKSVSNATPLPMVIFVTGYDQYALEAFEAKALAYLLKPIEPTRLAQAIERASNLQAGTRDRTRERERLLSAARSTQPKIRQIVCRKRDRLFLILPQDVFWFQVEDGIVKAKTTDQSYRVNYQIGELADDLPPDLFFRARRETLVNVTKIKEIRPYFKSGFLLVMADEANSEIVLSERQVAQFRRQVPGL